MSNPGSITKWPLNDASVSGIFAHHKHATKTAQSIEMFRHIALE